MAARGAPARLVRLGHVAIDVEIPREFRQLELHALEVLVENDLAAWGQRGGTAPRLRLVGKGGSLGKVGEIKREKGASYPAESCP